MNPVEGIRLPGKQDRDVGIAHGVSASINFTRRGSELNPIGRLWTEFFDADTRDFTLSCLRDLWKGSLVVICAIAFHYLLSVAHLPEWAKSTLEMIDLLWGIAAVLITALVFLGKLVFGRRRRR